MQQIRGIMSHINVCFTYLLSHVLGYRISIFVARNTLLKTERLICFLHCFTYLLCVYNIYFGVLMCVVLFVFDGKANDPSVAASLKALEERQDRILQQLHQLQLKMKKIVDEAELTKSIPQTSCVRVLFLVSYIFKSHIC